MKKHSTFLLIIILLFASLIPGLPAQAQSDDPTLHIDQVDTTGYPTVTIHLNVWDSSGLPLAGLIPADFNLREDGGAPFHPQTVQTETNTPLGVVLVMDISGSM